MESVVNKRPARNRTAVPNIRRAILGRRRTVTPELLQKVAEVYRQHFDKPTEAVRARLMCRTATAARYVQQARAAGHLLDTDPGKKRA